MPSWAMTSAQKIGRLVAIVRTRPGEDATSQAVAAVMPSPTNIHPYTARRNVPMCSAAAEAEPNVVVGVVS